MYRFRFLTDIYSEAHPGPSLRLKKTVQVVILQKQTNNDYNRVDKSYRNTPWSAFSSGWDPQSSIEGGRWCKLDPHNRFVILSNAPPHEQTDVNPAIFSIIQDNWR